MSPKLVTGERAGDEIPALLGAAQVVDDSVPYVTRQVEALARKVGIPKPTVWVLACPEANAMATGWSPYDSAVTVTTSALETLEPRELQAVVAHEIGHIVNGDVENRTKRVQQAISRIGIARGVRIASLAGLFTHNPVVRLATLGVRVASYQYARNEVTQVAQISQRQELAADHFADEMGCAPFLAAALSKIDRALIPGRVGVPEWGRSLLFFDRSKDASHPPLQTRLGNLGQADAERILWDACSSCGAPVPPGAAVCGVCRAAVTTQGCVHCGVPASPADRFCVGCGNRLPRRHCTVCTTQNGVDDPFCVSCGRPLP